MNYTLYTYQQEAVNAAWQDYADGNGNPCIVLPTGTGKSLVLAELAKTCIGYGGRVLVLAHVKELLQQNAEKIQSLIPDIPVGVYSAGLNRRDTEAQVLVAGIQSVAHRAKELGQFRLIIIDEIHMVPLDGEGRYRTFLKESEELYGKTGIIGLTATPYRLDGGEICAPGNIMTHICYTAPFGKMVNMGYLSAIVPFHGRWDADFSRLHTKCGEFDAHEVEEAVMQGGVTEMACADIVKKSSGRQAVLIFACSVAHCHLVKECIERDTKEECGLIQGDTPAPERAEMIARIRGENGTPDIFGNCQPPLRWLVNCGVLTTGFDAPRIDCVAVLRPTQSTGLFVQMVGRGTRLCEGKRDCLLLDYGGNVLRHGTLDDITIGESGMKKSKKKYERKERICLNCDAIIPKEAYICPQCGTRCVREEIDIQASERDIMGRLPEEKVEQVLDVHYEKHIKKSDENAPPTLEITYKIGLWEYVREWKCPEHMGYARTKFCEWWEKVSPGTETPVTVDEALERIETWGIAKPPKLRLKRKAGEKYWQVAGYECPSDEEVADLPF